MLAVSISVPPAPTKASSTAAAASASVSRPQVMVPRPSRDTSSPLRPTRRESMTANLATAGVGSRCGSEHGYRDHGVAAAPGTVGASTGADRLDRQVTGVTVTGRPSSPAGHQHPQAHYHQQVRGTQQRDTPDAHRTEPRLRDDSRGTPRQPRPGAGGGIAGLRHRLGGRGVRPVSYTHLTLPTKR